jgi:hypothetical protein
VTLVTKKTPIKHSDECFFIAPIGEEGSEERKRSDGVLEFIVAPAAQELGLSAVRADHIGQPGLITTQVIAHVLESKTAVVDLTGMNPNVFYELAIRHTTQQPTALIVEEGCKLPFDIAQMRTIFFCHTDLRSANECKLRIIEHLKEAIQNGATDSPVGATIDIKGLQAGSVVERTIVELVETTESLVRSQGRVGDMVEEVMRRLRSLERNPQSIPPRLMGDIVQALGHLQEVIIESCEDRPSMAIELADAYARLIAPIEYLTHEIGQEIERASSPVVRRIFSSSYIAGKLESPLSRKQLKRPTVDKRSLGDIDG